MGNTCQDCKLKTDELQLKNNVDVHLHPTYVNSYSGW